MSAEAVVRRATVDDAEHIAAHRVRMFEDMGQIGGAASDALRIESARVLRAMIASGEYVGWVAHPTGDPQRVVAGAGVQLRRVLPHPTRDARDYAPGRHAIVLNVYTQPEWRRRGIALQLMDAVLAWARAERIDRLVLHASDEGRPLYEKLGFVATNEMRFEGDLATG